LEHISHVVRTVLSAYLRDDPRLRRQLLGDEGFRVASEAAERAPAERVGRRQVREIKSEAAREGADAQGVLL
jgi:hypothetical protein